MPGEVDGRFLVEWLARHRPGIPAVIMNGCVADLEGDRPLSVAGVFSKPYDGAALVSMLRELVVQRTGEVPASPNAG
jgi:hypothetical protein